ncbi:hypothetical protein NFHSH190041_11660 [Shewanella sp. NFH-SH190041]|nr:hypothetical protein NFHSH190041_11660 [Shewanella sp. NFH-SH190041]
MVVLVDVSIVGWEKKRLAGSFSQIVVLLIVEAHRNAYSIYLAELLSGGIFQSLGWAGCT